MNFDISHLLEQWEYQPGQVVVRRFVGKDGIEKIQLRVDLGLLQMNRQGRASHLKNEPDRRRLRVREQPQRETQDGERWGMRCRMRKDPSERQLPLGLIAQEVEGVIPELILREADPAKPLGLNYLGLVPVLIKAIQEQQTTITTLKAEQEKQLEQLQARIARLERATKRRSAGRRPASR